MKISMHHYALIRIVAVFLVGLLPLCARAADIHLSVMDSWRTLEDERFSVNYKASNKELAEKTLAIAQHTLPQIEQFLQWKVPTRIYINVLDTQDAPNGWAEVVPYNHITVYTSPPTLFHEMNNFNRWMRVLLAHELTHIVHIDKAHGGPASLRKVFGRFPLLFPNQLQPNFFTEGLATYIETDWQRGSGRGQSPYYNMMMRVEVDTGILSLGQVQQNREQWPLNQAYLYGVYFYQFMEETYGKESIPAYINEYSSNLVPFMLSTSSMKVANKTIQELWVEYEGWLEDRFRNEIDQIKSAGVTPAEQITKGGDYNTRPLALDDGSLAYVEWSARKPASIVVKDRNGKKRALTKVKWRARLVAVEGDDIYFLQTSLCKDNYIYDELYRVSMKQWTEGEFTDVNRAKKMTSCRRFNHAALNADTKTWAIVKSLTGKQQLILLPLGKKKQQLLWSGSFEQQIAQPVWIDNDNLLVNIKQPDKKWQLYTLNIHNKIPVPLALDLPTGNVQTPFYDKETGQIFFTSDHSGIYEIYRSKIDGSQAERLTRSLGGSTDPVYANGKLYYSGYSSNGWDIYQIEPKPLLLTDDILVQSPVADNKGMQLHWEDDDIVKNPDAVKDVNYSPWQSLMPTSWFFGSQSTGDTQEIGVQVSGYDPLALHKYLFSYAYDINLEKASALLEYNFATHVFFGYKHSHDIYGNGESTFDSGFDISHYFTEEDWQIAAQYPVPYDFVDIQLFAAINKHTEELIDVLRTTGYTFYDKSVNTSGIGFIYSSGEKYMQGISISHGRRIKLALENDDADSRYRRRLKRGFLNGYNNGSWRVNALDWREYIYITNRHVLALHGFWGKGSDGADPFQLSSQQSMTTFTQSYVHERDITLRGYPDKLTELIDVNAELYSAEWRFPVWDVYKGIDGLPLGAHAIHGAFFYDSGAVWGTAPNPVGHGSRHIYDSFGVELNTDLDLAYSLLPLNAKIGYAQPLRKTAAGKSPELYFSLWASF